MPASESSLLERMIDRLTVQRDALAWAQAAVAGSGHGLDGGQDGGLDGLVLEIGLGKGRTYDHLRRLFPEQNILAFDLDVRVPPDLRPADDRLFVGDFRETLPRAASRFGRCARLAHADFGSTDRNHDRGQAEWLAPLIDALMLPGGIVLSDRPLDGPGWTRLALPNIRRWPYFAWQAGADR
jgi:hypothetical protein